MPTINGTGSPPRKKRSDAGKSRTRSASDKVVTEAARQKVKGFPINLLSELSGVSKEVISRFTSGGTVRASSATKMLEAIRNYQPKKAREKKAAESNEASERCAYLVDEDGGWHALGDLGEVRAKEKLICSWCLKAHEGKACEEGDL
jgi:hypothetical protein